MNRIIKGHLDSFVKSHGLDFDDEAVQFEKFANFAVLTPKVATSFDIENITTSNGDDGMDGVAVIIDEEIIMSDQDVEQIFKNEKRNHDVEIVFIQAKRSENFDLGDFLKFKQSILRLVNTDKGEYNIADDVQKVANSTFGIVLENVAKIRNGKPSIFVRYITTGIYQSPAALESAAQDFKNELKALGLFFDIDIKFIDRDELTSLWVGTYSGIKARLELFTLAALPEISGINEAYLAVVKAKDFVNNVLTYEGNLRTQVFEENVRAFLGLDNSVNHSISETLKSGEAATRFPVLNNGITIVSPNVIVQGNIMHLENFQIVNGCQTSNVLFENRAELDDQIMINLKVVETTNEDVFSELVRATNSQTKVDDTQFLSLRPLVKKIEQYFNSYDGDTNRIYLERRDRQFVGRDIPALRIFSVPTVSKCVVSMFCHRPDLAFRYQKQMFAEFGEIIFADDVKESIYYASCLTLYRLHILVSNNSIPQNSRKFKWHILPLIKIFICGQAMPRLNSHQISSDSERIIQFMCQPSDQIVDIFAQAVGIITSIENLTDDRLKRQTIFAEMLEKTKNINS